MDKGLKVGANENIDFHYVEDDINKEGVDKCWYNRWERVMEEKHMLCGPGISGKRKRRW